MQVRDLPNKKIIMLCGVTYMYVRIHDCIPASSEVENSQDQGHYEGYDQQNNEDDRNNNF